MHRITWCLGTATVLLLNVGCASLALRPEIRDVRPRITAIDLQGVSLAFDVDVHNPYPVALRTPRFRYGIDIQDTSFVESESDVTVDLPANQLGTATLPVGIGYKELWKIYSTLADSTDIAYRLRGAFAVTALERSFELPLSHTGTFPVLRLPTFAIKDVSFSDASLSHAGVTVETEIGNPNVFDIDVRDLGYAVRLGDVQVGRVHASTVGNVPAGEAGRLTLSGEITARSALLQLFRGESLGQAHVSPIGSMKTPYGPVELAQ